MKRSFAFVALSCATALAASAAFAQKTDIGRVPSDRRIASDSVVVGNTTALNRGFAGPLDEVCIYNRVLTPAEVAALP